MPRVSSQAIQLAPGLQFRQPARFLFDARGVERLAPVAQRQQQHQHVVEPVRVRFEVRGAQPIAALGRLPACQRDELAQVAVAGARGGQQHELGTGPQALRIIAFVELNLGAVDQPERACRFVSFARLGERQVRAHRTRERTLVGERQSRVFERERALDQFLRMRRAAQEREVRQAVQLGVGRCHREGVIGRAPSRLTQTARAGTSRAGRRVRGRSTATGRARCGRRSSRGARHVRVSRRRGRRDPTSRTRCARGR